MADVYDILGELLLEGHGEIVRGLCEWYVKYNEAGLSHQALRTLLVSEGFLPNPLDPIVNRIKGR